MTFGLIEPENSENQNTGCRYTNREEGKPLYVSVLIYLDEDWPDELHAETLVLDEVTYDLQQMIFKNLLMTLLLDAFIRETFACEKKMSGVRR